MEKVMGDFYTLYHREDPHSPGISLATHVGLIKLSDVAPSEAYAEAAVWCLRHFKSGGPTHLRAEHLKKWLQEAYPREGSTPSPRNERCMSLVDIVQRMWRTGETPQELGWTVLVLIPKVSNDTWGVGLL